MRQNREGVENGHGGEWAPKDARCTPGVLTLPQCITLGSKVHCSASKAHEHRWFAAFHFTLPACVMSKLLVAPSYCTSTPYLVWWGLQLSGVCWTVKWGHGGVFIRDKGSGGDAPPLYTPDCLQRSLTEYLRALDCFLWHLVKVLIWAMEDPCTLSYYCNILTWKASKLPYLQPSPPTTLSTALFMWGQVWPNSRWWCQLLR